MASSGVAARMRSHTGSRSRSSGSAKEMKGRPARSTRGCAEIGAATRMSWPARRMAEANGTSGPKWPAPAVEARRTRMSSPGRRRRPGPIPGAGIRRCSISSVARDQHVGDERGREQPVVDHAGRRRQPGGERGRVVERAEVVGDRPAVGAERHVAQLRRSPSARSVAGMPNASSSSGTGGPSASTTLSPEAITTKRSAAAATTFSRVCAPPPPLMTQLSGIDLVGAVDRDVEPVELLERLDREPERAGGDLGGDRGGDAAQRQPAAGERRQQRGDGRAGAEADPARRPRSARRGLGRGALVGLAVSHRR